MYDYIVCTTSGTIVCGRCIVCTSTTLYPRVQVPASCVLNVPEARGSPLPAPHVLGTHSIRARVRVRVRVRVRGRVRVRVRVRVRGGLGSPLRRRRRP